MSSFSQKYQEIQASCYSKLRYVFFKYLEFNASERVTVNEVMENLTEDSDVVITSTGVCYFWFSKGTPSKVVVSCKKQNEPKKIGRLHDYWYLPDNFHNGGFGHFSIS